MHYDGTHQKALPTPRGNDVNGSRANICTFHHHKNSLHKLNTRLYMASIFITKIVDFKFSIFWEPILGNKTYDIHFELLLNYEWKPKIEIIRHSVESFFHKMNETFSSCTIWCKKNFLRHVLYMILPIWWRYLSHVTTNLFDPYQPWVVW